MSELQQAEVDAVVSADGDVVIPSEAVRRLALVPGQHLTVTVTGRPRRRPMYGILAGRLSDPSLDDIARTSRQAWGDLGTDR